LGYKDKTQRRDDITARKSPDSENDTEYKAETSWFIFESSSVFLRSFNGIRSEKMYIDPNTGGMLFQALAGLLAVISGGLFFFSRQIRTGIARLRRRFRKDEDETTE
jgi:hypothetical protein